MTLPLRIGDDIFGALSFGSMTKERTWLLDRLGSVANLVAGVLARRRTDRELRAALEEIGRLRDRLEGAPSTSRITPAISTSARSPSPAKAEPCIGTTPPWW